MDERVVQFRIGVMVLATAIITGILLTMFGGERRLFRGLWGREVFYIQFPEAPGVTVDTPVQKSGIRIGRVTQVRLAEEVTDVKLGPHMGVLVAIELDEGRQIFRDEKCRLSRNLLGDAYLEFVKNRRDRPSESPSPSSKGNPPDAANQPRKVWKPGELLTGEVVDTPIEVVGNLEEDLLRAIRSVADTSEQIRDFVGKVSELVGAKEDLEPKRQRLDAIMEKTLSTMERMEALTQHANDVLGDEVLKQQLKDAVAEAPQVVQEARATLTKVRETLAGMDETVRRMNTNLRNVEEFTEPLGKQGGAIVDRLARGADRLEGVLDEVYTFSRSLNSRQGTVGQLIHNPELYENLNRAVANVEDLTDQLRPVVRDARVFSDKIARHPELLGVRGAIQRNTGTKGVPRLSELERTSYVPQPSTFPRFIQPR